MAETKITTLAQKLILEHGIKPLDTQTSGSDVFSFPSAFIGTKVELTVYPIGLVKADNLSSKRILYYADQFHEIARSLSFSDFLGALDPRRLTAKMGFLGFVFEEGADPERARLITGQKRGNNLTFGSVFTAGWVLDCKTFQVQTHKGYPVANRWGFYFDKESLEAVLRSANLRELPNSESIENPAQAALASRTPDLSQHRIFLSYRRSDSADISGRIYDRLAAKFGKAAVFKDVDSIPLGVNFKEFLDAQVNECTVLLAVIGNQWLNASTANGTSRLQDPTDFVRIEIESALKRNIPIIPLLVSGASMPAASALPSGLSELAYRNGIQIRPDPDFHHDMDRLISSLEKYI